MKNVLEYETKRSVSLYIEYTEKMIDDRVMAEPCVIKFKSRCKGRSLFKREATLTNKRVCASGY